MEKDIQKSLCKCLETEKTNQAEGITQMTLRTFACYNWLSV